MDTDDKIYPTLPRSDDAPTCKPRRSAITDVSPTLPAPSPPASPASLTTESSPTADFSTNEYVQWANQSVDPNTKIFQSTAIITAILNDSECPVIVDKRNRKVNIISADTFRALGLSSMDLEKYPGRISQQPDSGPPFNPIGMSRGKILISPFGKNPPPPRYLDAVVVENFPIAASLSREFLLDAEWIDYPPGHHRSPPKRRLLVQAPPTATTPPPATSGPGQSSDPPSSTATTSTTTTTPAVCDVCQASFPSPGALQTHLLSHKTWPCLFCQFIATKEEDQWLKHLLDKHAQAIPRVSRLVQSLRPEWFLRQQQQ